MQFFPANRHCLARFQVFDSTCHFPIPSLLERFSRALKTVKQCVGERSALVNWQCERQR